MRELPQSGCRRVRIVPPGRRALGLILLGLMTAPNLVEGQTQSDTSLSPTADSARSAGRLYFSKALPFETEYLTRLAEMARNRPRVSVPEEESAAALAAVYAQRYRISPELAQRIITVARAEGLDPDLGFRLVRVESTFVTRAHGPGGALGLTQLMPSTARSMDRSLRTESQILDPQTNLKLGFRYLRQMIERYDGNVRLGVLAYNRGEVAVDRALRRGRDPENGYSLKVLGTRSGNPYRGRGVLKK